MAPCESKTTGHPLRSPPSPAKEQLGQENKDVDSVTKIELVESGVQNRDDPNIKCNSVNAYLPQIYNIWPIILCYGALLKTHLGNK